MTRIDAKFADLKSQGKKAFVAYVMAGDPDFDTSLEVVRGLPGAGVDIIELGLPFTDPMADGPVIQLAMERALAHEVSLRQVLEMVAEFRQRDNETPVVLMGYLNPVERMGYDEFAREAAEAGVDGVLTVDLPPEEAADVVPLFKARGLDTIFLLAPTTTLERARSICQQASGYVYYVSLKGVTGSSALDVTDVANKLDMLRTVTDLPIGVGFGIRDGATAAAVGEVADGVVVGSVLVNQIAANAENPDAARKAISAIIAEMRGAMDH